MKVTVITLILIITIAPIEADEKPPSGWGVFKDAIRMVTLGMFALLFGFFIGSLLEKAIRALVEWRRNRGELMLTKIAFLLILFSMVLLFGWLNLSYLELYDEKTDSWVYSIVFALGGIILITSFYASIIFLIVYSIWFYIYSAQRLIEFLYGCIDWFTALMDFVLVMHRPAQLPTLDPLRY